MEKHKSSKMRNPSKRENQKRKLESSIPSGVASCRDRVPARATLVCVARAHARRPVREGSRLTVDPRKDTRLENTRKGEERKRKQKKRYGVAT